MAFVHIGILKLNMDIADFLESEQVNDIETTTSTYIKRCDSQKINSNLVKNKKWLKVYNIQAALGDKNNCFVLMRKTDNDNQILELINLS